MDNQRSFPLPVGPSRRLRPGEPHALPHREVHVTNTPLFVLFSLLGCGPGDDKDSVDTSETATHDSADTATASQDSADTADTLTEAPSIWPEAPYVDSLFSVWLDGSAVSKDCVWWVNDIETDSVCSPLGEDLGLSLGDRVAVSLNGSERSAEVEVIERPDLLVTETMASPGRLSLLDGVTGVVLHQVQVGGAMPYTMPIAPVVVNDVAYFTAHLGYINGEGIHKVGGEPLDEQTTANASGTVYWADADPDTDSLWVADMARTALTPYGLDDLEMGVPLSLPMPPVTIRIQDGIGWVASNNGGSPTGGSIGPKGETPAGYLSRVELASGTIDSVEIGEAPYWAEPSPSGDLIAVADTDADTLVLVSSDLEVVATYPVGEAPTGVAWSPQGTEIYVALYSGGAVVSLDPTTGETLQQWDLKSGKATAGVVGVYPRADGRYLYVPVLHENRLVVIDTATEAEPESWEGVTGPRGVAFW